MNGRIQIDLFNFFRREENLTSYKLDYVAGHFIGDYVKTLDYSETDGTTTIQTTNMTGLLVGSYIHFEEIGHSIDYYNNGEKFVVLEVLKQEGKFKIGAKICPDQSKKTRWCLAKDDVTPKDIFTMTNGTADDRAVIAKYCIQDCNLVHYLMNKVDILTGFIEMAKICSVPINFLVLRGQGIKLTSYVAKKCREKRTLMPVVEKSEDEDGFEGAIVLDPKCDLYLDNPVACVDYASLYPSSMMSENISHDSKVWTLEYDLDGQLVCETGEKNAEGLFIYDNLPGYEYVNITYDTFMYVRKTPSAAAEKVKCGHKICRFAQPLNGARAIMPSILEELLMARKTTRKLIPAEKDEFMKNVLDKRQIGYKLTANSLYGQCGAKTSSFYDKDCAASTTATGRLLLTYAKKVVEECYGNAICETANYGPVLTKAEYIYGDSVANYTPVYISTFKKGGAKCEENRNIEICTIEQLSEKYGENNWVKCTEEGKQEKEFCELQGVETWTEKGWTKLHRVIRHELAPHKKMIRILTHTGLVDVTDDHSLIAKDGTELSPKEAKIGTELLHHRLETTMGMFSSIGTDDECVNKMYKFNLNNDKNHLLYAKICAMIQSYSTSKLYINLSNETNNNYNLDVLFTDSYNDNKIIHLEEIEYQGYVYDLTTDNHHFAAGIGNVIVHNTDSVFFTFNLQTPDGTPIRGKDALEITIELAQQAGHLASKFLKAPHDLEYEKTFMPFCLLSKKRYVGMLYETDPTKCKRKEMGIVLKRRDNAPIVKEIYGGIIDILMKEQDIGKAVDFLRSSLRNIVDEKYSMDKLIISKSLRSGYKNPQQIAHKVLADRITLRDPGNKPGSGDRIPYVFVHNPDKKAKQGERIETPTYIKEKGLKIDYSHYITNQIMKPTQQVFALVLEKMWDMQNKKSKISKFKREVDALRIKTKPEKFEDKLNDLKEKEVKALLFDEFLRETNNQKESNRPLTGFFTPLKI
jgi:DNA polymerase elongation subunit (family B)